jgi:hypothetical protein
MEPRSLEPGSCYWQAWRQISLLYSANRRDEILRFLPRSLSLSIAYRGMSFIARIDNEVRRRHYSAKALRARVALKLAVR